MSSQYRRLKKRRKLYASRARKYPLLHALIERVNKEIRERHIRLIIEGDTDAART